MERQLVPGTTGKLHRQHIDHHVRRGTGHRQAWAHSDGRWEPRLRRCPAQSGDRFRSEWYPVRDGVHVSGQSARVPWGLQHGTADHAEQRAGRVRGPSSLHGPTDRVRGADSDLVGFFWFIAALINLNIIPVHSPSSSGTHRPLWPRYGEYEFVPPQRWLHNSEHGAVIALYHPCANKQQIDEFRQIVKSCLYRHIITPSDLPSRDRPFALVTWHAKLEFSVLERTVVEDFIRAYSLKGPEQTSRDGQYDHLLVEPAAVVSTRDDEVLCPKHKRRD